MTRANFAIKVLSKLRAYDKTTPSAADQNAVLDAYDGVYQQLKDDGLVTWTQSGTEDIPVRFVNALVKLVAAELVDVFPLPEGTAQRYLLESAAAKNMIRRQLASGQPVEPVTADYF